MSDEDSIGHLVAAIVKLLNATSTLNIALMPHINNAPKTDEIHALLQQGYDDVLAAISAFPK